MTNIKVGSIVKGNKEGFEPTKGKIGIILSFFDKPDYNYSRWIVYWFESNIRKEYSHFDRTFPETWLEVVVP